MKNSEKLILEKVVRLTKSSESKFREGDFKGSIEDKMKVKSIINSKLCGNDIKKKLNDVLSVLYISRFDLIYDHKARIDDLKRNQISNLLEQKSEEKYKKGDFKGAIRALRRSEKYQLK